MTTKLGLLGKALIIAFLTTSLSACVIYFTKTGDVEEKKDKSILLVGYLDDSEAPFKFRWGQVRQYRPSIKKPYHDVTLDKKGLFYIENLPVGSYGLDSLGGPEKGFFTDISWDWSFSGSTKDTEFKQTKVKAKRSGVYYMGAYKIHLARKGGLFRAAKYKTTALEGMSEKEVLQQLLPFTIGTKWEAIVKKRIKKLR